MCVSVFEYITNRIIIIFQLYNNNNYYCNFNLLHAYHDKLIDYNLLYKGERITLICVLYLNQISTHIIRDSGSVFKFIFQPQHW